MSLSYSTYAQKEPYSFGFRLSGGVGFDAEVSYQHFIGNTTKMEGAFGIFSSVSKQTSHEGYKFSGLYIREIYLDKRGKAIINIGGGFSAGHSVYNGLSSENKFSKQGVYFAIPLLVGIEYTMDTTPLSFSVDLRPEIVAKSVSGQNSAGGVGVTLRYLMGNY